MTTVKFLSSKSKKNMYEKNSLQNCDSLPPATIYILVGVFFVV